MEYITKAQNAGLYTTALALDVAQFFPCDIIVRLLLKEGFSPLLATLFESYYDDRLTKYLWNAHFSKDYDINNGVPQGDPLSPIISVLYMSAMLNQLFPYADDCATQCMSYIDDFVLMTASPSLETNVDMLENDFIQLSQAFNSLGVTIETSKTELMHFATKQQTSGKGRKPIHFNCLHSLLPKIELHPTWRHMPTYIIAPSHEWHYLGFFFDPFLSFDSHCCRYTSKALVATNNLRILGHSGWGGPRTMQACVPSRRLVSPIIWVASVVQRKW